ncbi:MAG: HAMP domain-containing histidine kinase [Candidatus Goldbacteria bacterium]|nr:HAMP domain-containing histidine kinase [Candidatus Goldiibacteriota bacterium]
MARTIRVKVFMYFLISAAFIITVFGIITYNFILGNIESEMENRLLSAGRIIAADINPEDIALIGLKGKVYTGYLAKLANLKEILKVKDVFVIEPSEGKVIISTLKNDGKYFIKVDEYEIDKALSGVAASSRLYAGKGGEYFKTGYVPVKNKNIIAGAVGVEASVEYLQYVSRYRIFLIVMGAFAIAASFILAFIISSGITVPLRRLKEKAEKLSKRDFSEKIETKGGAEIKVLADAMENMRVEVKQYMEQRDKMADVGEFSAGVAHEIRNSLGVLLGYAELINEKTQDEKVKKYSADIIKNTLKMSEFINNFLSYTKDFIPDRQNADLNKLLEETVFEMPEKVKTAIKIESAGAGLFADVDIYLIKKALYNVLLNAYQSLDKDKKQITLSAGEESGEVYVSVKDNGTGIKKDNIKKIFQPFFTGRKEGHGLGLPIAYKIIHEAHGGDIKVFSEEGKGTEFRLFIGKKSTA